MRCEAAGGWLSVATIRALEVAMLFGFEPGGVLVGELGGLLFWPLCSASSTWAALPVMARAKVGSCVQVLAAFNLVRLPLLRLQQVPPP